MKGSNISGIVLKVNLSKILILIELTKKLLSHLRTSKRFSKSKMMKCSKLFFD